jgi:hypothetical protein
MDGSKHGLLTYRKVNKFIDIKNKSSVFCGSSCCGFEPHQPPLYWVISTAIIFYCSIIITPNLYDFWQQGAVGINIKDN